MKRADFAIVFVLSLLFCANAWSLSQRDVVNARQSGDDGVARVYHVNEQQAWEIAAAVLHWQHSNRIEDRHDLNCMLTSIGASTCACRMEVGVWIEPVNEGDSKVTIITRGKSSNNIFTNIETFPDMVKPDFHTRFQQAVDMIKSGKQLPFNPP